MQVQVLHPAPRAYNYELDAATYKVVTGELCVEELYPDGGMGDTQRRGRCAHLSMRVRIPLRVPELKL